MTEQEFDRIKVIVPIFRLALHAKIQWDKHVLIAICVY